MTEIWKYGDISTKKSKVEEQEQSDDQTGFKQTKKNVRRR